MFFGDAAPNVSTFIVSNVIFGCCVRTAAATGHISLQTVGDVAPSVRLL